MITKVLFAMGGRLLAILGMLILGFGCTSVRQMTTGAGAGGQSGGGSVPSAVSLDVFGSQPKSPTDAAMVTLTTWGAVYGAQSLCANEAGSRALVQQISGATPILFDRQTGWAWKQACHNRITPFVPQSVGNSRLQGGVVQNSTITQNWKFSLVDTLNVSTSINGRPVGGGYGRPMPACPPQGYGGNRLYRNGNQIPQWGLAPSNHGRPMPVQYPPNIGYQNQHQRQNVIVENRNLNNNNNTVRYIER
jgi:hypothetical protein